MIRWPGAQNYPDIIAVVCRYEPIPGPQMDTFLEWCDRWGRKPSELRVCVTVSPMSISEWLFKSNLTTNLPKIGGIIAKDSTDDAEA